jgi:23S rRNA-/tRNA-specific pseudouridylate synthase
MWKIDTQRIDQTLFTRRLSYEYVDGPPTSCSSLLALAAPHIPSDEWQARLAWGGAFVNGLPIGEDAAIAPPARVEYFEPRFSIEQSDEWYPKWSSSWILFQDEHIVVAYKPARLPTLPAREQPRYNFRSYLETYIGRAVHLPTRLDTSTSGLVVASISAEAHRLLQQQFEQKQVIKEYLCEVGAPVTYMTLAYTGPIGRHPLHPILRCIRSPGKAATTLFTKLEGRSSSALLLARPITGRTHQIRVHCATLGAPIIGDAFYDGAALGALRLCCWRLTLKHPISHQRSTYVLPATFLPEWATVPYTAQT